MCSGYLRRSSNVRVDDSVSDNDLSISNYQLFRLQWNPSIVATIGERPSGLYRGVATSQGFYMIALCACAYECLAALAAPSRPSPISRLFHAGCTSS